MGEQERGGRGTETPLRAPFPYFGGKSRIAPIVWRLLGNTPNYVEPLCGSAAVLLARPDTHCWWERIETINDWDALLSNAWRAIKNVPDEVVYWADEIVSEVELHSRHIWLVERKAGLQARLEGDVEFYDSRAAGYWLYGMSCWIGSGFCAGDGPWRSVNGELIRDSGGEVGQGVRRKCVHLGDAGRGMNRGRVHLSDSGTGVNRKRVHLGNPGTGVHRKRIEIRGQKGINRQRIHLTAYGRGVCSKRVDVGEGAESMESGNLESPEGGGLWFYMERLANRLRRVRVCCGDWKRVMGPCVTSKNGLTGIFLDPPYAVEAGRSTGIYNCDTLHIAQEVREWCVANGENELLRIILAGYAGEGHEILEERGWRVVPWKAQGGYGLQSGQPNENKHRERLWVSPQCLPLIESQPRLL